MQPKGRGQPLKLISGLAAPPANEKAELSTLTAAAAGGDPFEPSSAGLPPVAPAAGGAMPFWLGKTIGVTCVHERKPHTRLCCDWSDEGSKAGI